MRRLLAITGFILGSVVATTATAEPRTLTVELKKHTLVTLTIPYDMGTRFTFPFILDEQSDYVPFTLNTTNPLFVENRAPARNYFVLTPRLPQNAKANANYLGNSFITVAGYEITIELKANNDYAHHYSDVIFKLGPEDRETLIQKAVAQRTEQLEQTYAKKLADLDHLADQKSIARVGRLALTSPSHTRIKEEGKLKLPNGDNIILYVDQAIHYDPYTIFAFDIGSESSSQGVSIIDAKLFAVDPDTKRERPIDAGKDLPPHVEPRSEHHAAITALSANLDPKELLMLRVLTDKGTLEAVW
jgi:hypothetical protein